MNKYFVIITVLLLVSLYEVTALDMQAKMQIESTEGKYLVHTINNEPFEVYLVLDFPQLEGLQAERALPVVITVPIGISKNVFSLEKLKNAKRYAYKSAYGFVYAHPQEVKHDDVLYFFPFEHGTRHRITQGWNGKFSHSGQNQYSVDFDLKKGTEIYAAREGMVVAIKEDSQWGGIGPQYEKHTNYVLIRHSDNTFSQYAHLQYEGVIVGLGDTVKVGDFIAYSGATGYGSGPHLHFDVRVPTMEGLMQSIPFSFRDVDGKKVIPQSGRTYYASFPDGPEFEIVRGEDIVKGEYKEYISEIDATHKRDTIQIRQEIIDDIVILFISNGFLKAISADVHITPTNLRIEDSLPITVEIPARKEVFLTFAYIKDISKRVAISSQFKYRIIE